MKAFLQPHGLKVLSPGRVVVLNTGVHGNAVAVVLQQGLPSKKDKTFKVMVICQRSSDDEDQPAKTVNDASADNCDWMGFGLHFVGGHLFHPVGHCGQAVLEVGMNSITSITSKVLKINAERIIDDVKKREMPRFR